VRSHSACSREGVYKDYGRDSHNEGDKGKHDEEFQEGESCLLHLALSPEGKEQGRARRTVFYVPHALERQFRYAEYRHEHRDDDKTDHQPIPSIIAGSMKLTNLFMRP